MKTRRVVAGSFRVRRPVAVAVEVARAQAGQVGRLRIGYVDGALGSLLPEVIRAFLPE